jgi:hypothetical protein
LLDLLVLGPLNPNRLIKYPAAIWEQLIPIPNMASYIANINGRSPSALVQFDNTAQQAKLNM